MIFTWVMSKLVTEPQKDKCYGLVLKNTPAARVRPAVMKTLTDECSIHES